jgi:hypothetical protein
MLIETDKIVGWLSPYRHIQRGPGGSNLEGGGGGVQNKPKGPQS